MNFLIIDPSTIDQLVKDRLEQAYLQLLARPMVGSFLQRNWCG